MFNHLLQRAPNWAVGLGLIAASLVVLVQIFRDQPVYCEGRWFAECPDLSGLESAILITPKECTRLGDKWERYEPAEGRFVIAAGTATDARGEKRSFTISSSRPNTGGTYQHVLTVPQMPSHDHQYDARKKGHKKIDCGTSCITFPAEPRQTVTTGGGQPHPNVPPYVVLNLCHIP